MDDVAEQADGRREIPQLVEERAVALRVASSSGRSTRDRADGVPNALLASTWALSPGPGRVTSLPNDAVFTSKNTSKKASAGSSPRAPALVTWPSECG